MLKIIFIMVFVISMLNASDSKSKGGCELAQIGDVQLSLVNVGDFNAVTYKAISSSGKNFRTILVGSVMSIESKNIKAEIIDIKADKRVRKQPRTGIITLKLNYNGYIQKIKMRYRYFKEQFSAKGILKDGEKISFQMRISAILCGVK